ncbi:MAG: EAL domain-containing protein [Chloroflexota bacterium]|nr:EAL domain-containing protein [Chloroflexota bacterium]
MAIVRLRPAELKQALETGALSLHYQPQVMIKTGGLAGVEAFVRWPHPAHGMIGPSDIVPLVDQAGLHVEFDRWVVGAICRQAKKWRADGVAVPVVAANVWSETLRRPDALRLVDALAETHVDPTTIELECPRGSTVDPEVTKALVAIKALGVRLASEEYATGARPRWILSFDTFKIPYPISRDHIANADGIVAAVAEARRTGARVVADSVESAAQEAALASLGVEIVQGYLYGPEVTPAELRTLIKRPGVSLA